MTSTKKGSKEKVTHNVIIVQRERINSMIITSICPHALCKNYKSDRGTHFFTWDVPVAKSSSKMFFNIICSVPITSISVRFSHKFESIPGLVHIWTPEIWRGIYHQYLVPDYHVRGCSYITSNTSLALQVPLTFQKLVNSLP